MEEMVTAIMPAYNAEAYIGQAIESALGQTVPCRIIIINDASCDRTGSIVDRYAEQYPDRICILDNDENRGVSFSRNRGVRHAVTEYIAFLDADDWWDACKTEKQLQALRGTEADACYSGRELMSAEGDSTGKIVRVPEQIDYQGLLRGNVISCSSVLLRRETAMAYPMSHDELHEDYIVWLSMLRDGKEFVGIDQPLLKSRLTEHGKSRNKLKSAKMTYGVYRYMGISPLRAMGYFCSYAWAGVRKYMR